jgi:hypothetical protein
MSTEKKESKYTVSEDTFDYLDTQVDEFNDTDNLGEKIVIHNNLKTITQNLIEEIDSMVEMIDDIDNESLNDEIIENNDNIDDDIIKLEGMIENMEEEESMLLKIKHYKRIIGIVKKCKNKTNQEPMQVFNVQ